MNNRTATTTPLSQLTMAYMDGRAAPPSLLVDVGLYHARGDAALRHQAIREYRNWAAPAGSGLVAWTDAAIIGHGMGAYRRHLTHVAGLPRRYAALIWMRNPALHERATALGYTYETWVAATAYVIREDSLSFASQVADRVERELRAELAAQVGA